MAKTQKELAFLRDLYINADWTRRFTDLIDKHFDLSDSESLLYVNAGTGLHAMALGEKLDEKLDVFATCEDEYLLTIARDKAAVLKSKVDFSMLRFEDDSFDAVLVDASFVPPDGYQSLLDDAARTGKTGAAIGILAVTAGSFGEIFSLLWEVEFNEGIGEHGQTVENLISELPTVWNIEEMAKAAGLVNLQTHVATEVFEYDNGAAFVSSPLMENLFFPAWLRSLDESDQERVTKELAELIDREDGSLSFRFSVKAVLLTGEKG